jgi:hypothetical protein
MVAQTVVRMVDMMAELKADLMVAWKVALMV